jgi:translation initiation factor IF-2
MAENKGVKILENDVIYRTLDQVKEVLEAKLPPIVTQRVLGEAEIAAGFEIGLGGRKRIKIAGCKVRNGVVGMKSKVRVMRGGVGGAKVYDGELEPDSTWLICCNVVLTAWTGLITSLKNVKKDVQEMRKGTECGMGFENWEGFEVGDVVQTYEEISEKRRL